MVEFVTELWDLFKVAVLPITISVLYDVLKRPKSEKTGRTMWINSLRTCKEIDKPLNEFENATVFESKKMMFDIILKPILIGSFYSFILVMGLVIISSTLINLHPITQLYRYLLMGLLIVAINFFFFYSSADETKFTDAISYEIRCKKLIISKTRINYSIFYFNTFALYLIYVYGKKIYEQAISETTSLVSTNDFISITIDNYYFSMLLLWVVGVSIGMYAYLFTKNNYNKFLSKYESDLNFRYNAGYPFVETNIPEVKGKVESIFDKEFLILNNEGVKKIIPWDSLKYLEISCGEF